MARGSKIECRPHPIPPPGPLKKGTKRLLHASTLAIGLTGVAWAWMRYIWDAGPEPMDPELLMEWSGVHPREPLTRTLHLLAAPIAVFAVGVIWQGHVAPRVMNPWARRRTGLVLVLLFAPMVLSGVLLQTATTAESRNLWVWVHGITGGLWFFGYGAHLMARRTMGAPRVAVPQGTAASD